MENNKKTKEYWEKRARENENKVYAKGSEVKKALEEHYLKARKEIRKSISELVARYMDKTELSYIEAVTYLTSSEFKEWRMTLEEYEEEIKRLEKISPEFARKLRIELETLAIKSRITRLESLNTQIDMELAKKSIKDYDVIRDGVSKTYSDFFKIQTTEFGLDGANTVLPKKTIEMLMQQPWSGSNFSERIWDNSSALARVLKQEIIQAFMQGVSVKDLSDRIEKRFENDRYNTERLVRTELNYALNQSTKLSYDEAGIKEYEFLAEIDSRTSDICRELNGQIFKMKDARAGVNYPPMHPHCRSTTIPVMNYEDIKTRKTKSKKEKTEPIKDDIIKVENEKIKSSMGIEDYNSYMKLINENINKNIKELYFYHSNNISNIEKTPNGGVYIPLKNKIEYSYPGKKYINEGMSKYTTLAHEYGHFFDKKDFYNNLNYKEVEKLNERFNLGSVKIFKVAPSSSDEFLLAFQKDKELLAKKFMEWKEDINTTPGAGVQDALDGMFGTQDKRLTSWGHGDKYYNRKYNNYIKGLGLEKELKNIYQELGYQVKNQSAVKMMCRKYETTSEAWANICSAVTCGGKELEYTQKYLPNMYEAFLKIIKNVKKGV